MGQRVIRVNELLKREISSVLHTRFRSRAVSITITDVDTAQDLRKATAYYAVIGDEAKKEAASRFFRSHGHEIQREVVRSIVLKYHPQIEFRPDPGIDRGSRLDAIFADLGMEPGETPPLPAPEPPPPRS